MTLPKQIIPSQRGQKRREKGLLLLEVLLVVLVLSTCLTLIVRSLVMSLRANVYVKDYTQAMWLLDNKMFDVLTTTSGELLTGAEESFDPPFDKYRYKVLAQDPEIDPGFTVGRMDEIIVEVHWSLGQQEKKVSSAIYMVNPEEFAGI